MIKNTLLTFWILKCKKLVVDTTFLLLLSGSAHQKKSENRKKLLKSAFDCWLGDIVETHCLIKIISKVPFQAQVKIIYYVLNWKKLVDTITGFQQRWCWVIFINEYGYFISWNLKRFLSMLSLNQMYNISIVLKKLLTFEKKYIVHNFIYF